MDQGGIERGDLTFGFFLSFFQPGGGGGELKGVYMLLLDHDANKGSPLGMDSLDYRELTTEEPRANKAQGA